MKKLNINNFKEKVYYEKLENGLEVFLVPIPKKNNYTCMLGVKYGGRNTKFKIDGKLIETPTGIAHFLEHKLFERKEDPFSFFGKSGTDVNAATGYDITSYYIYGNKNYKKNLEYMANWLKQFDITEDGVKKEQGIILEEAKMYEDMPDQILNNKTKENVFKKDPYRNKIIGTFEDIKNTTKEQIKLCFDSFYRPNNMFLISVGNFNPNEAIKIIKKANEGYQKNSTKVEKYFDEEPDEIYKKYEKIPTNIDIPRVSVSYKINKSKLMNLGIKQFDLELYLHVLINISLGMTSSIREEWLNKGLLIGSHYNIVKTKTHYVITFIAISNKPDEIAEEFAKYIQNVEITKDLFERQKKLWMAGEIKSSISIKSIEYNILDDILDYGYFIEDKLKHIKNLKYENLIKLKNNLEFKNKSVVQLTKKTK